MRYEYLPYWLVFIHFVFIHANSTHFSTWSHSKTLVMKKQSVCSSKSTQIDLFFNDRVFPPTILFDYYFQTLKSASSKFSNKYKYVWSCNIIYRKKNHKKGRTDVSNVISQKDQGSLVWCHGSSSPGGGVGWDSLQPPMMLISRCMYVWMDGSLFLSAFR